MNKTHSGLLFILALIASKPTFSLIESHTIAYEYNWPPYSYQLNSGKLEGIIIDIVRIALSRADLQSEATSFPLDQAKALVKENIISGFITTADKIPAPAISSPNEKENKSKNQESSIAVLISSEPIITIRSKAFVLKKNKDLINLKKTSSFNELEPLKICIDRNNNWAKQQVKSHQIKALFSKNQADCFRKIALNRYDLTITQETLGKQLLTMMELEKKFTLLPYSYRTLRIVLVTHQQSELAESLPKFNAAIKEMRKDGTIQNVIQTYAR
ncbi:substrate-binding periplasmic protein [Piscirickettsia salmonis]|uniref:substrate-binding periplasmic protein n=1 Tax=Piscirickettsia salmonis TaxID=1238 RepID=UPI0007C892A8